MSLPFFVRHATRQPFFVRTAGDVVPLKGRQPKKPVVEQKVDQVGYAPMIDEDLNVKLKPPVSQQSINPPRTAAPLPKPSKPIKQMNPEELAGYRQQSAQAKSDSMDWINSHPRSSQNIVDHWNQTTPDHMQQGMNWYADAHHAASTIANDTGISTNQAAGLIANYSPQQHWAQNLRMASMAAHGNIVGGPKQPGQTEGFMASGAQAEAARRIMGGEDYHNIFAGQKISAFGHLIEHGQDTDANDPKVVVDRHALGVAHGGYADDGVYNYSGVSSRPAVYNEISNQYKDAADQINQNGGYNGQTVQPHQVQAATWLTRQRLNAEGGYSSEGTAPRVQAVAASNVNKWNAYAQQYHPSLVGKVPGTGFSAETGGYQHDTQTPPSQPQQAIAFFVRKGQTSFLVHKALTEKDFPPMHDWNTYSNPVDHEAARQMSLALEDHFSHENENQGDTHRQWRSSFPSETDNVENREDDVHESAPSSQSRYAGYVAGGDWAKTYGSSRDIRKAARDIQGLPVSSNKGTPDPHLDQPIPDDMQGHESEVHPQEASVYAHTLLRGIHHAPPSDTPMYRGVSGVGDLPGFLNHIKQNGTFDMPLASFSNSAGAAASYGEGYDGEGDEEESSPAQLRFDLEPGSKGITGVPLQGRDDDPYEYVTGGKFQVTHVTPHPDGKSAIVGLKHLSTYDPDAPKIPVTAGVHFDMGPFDHLFEGRVKTKPFFVRTAQEHVSFNQPFFVHRGAIPNLTFTHLPPGEMDRAGRNELPGKGKYGWQHRIKAYDGDTNIGYLDFDEHASYNKLHQELPPNTIQEIMTHPDYRMQGVGKAMWDHAKSLGYELKHSPDLTPDGRAFSEHVSTYQPFFVRKLTNA
jgi:hypothetical protein